MSIAQALLAEFEMEADTTRRFLQQLPKDSLAWKPHPKSATAGGLAMHLAQVPGAVLSKAVQDSFEAPDFSKGFPAPTSKEEILETLEGSIATVRKLLPTLSDERLAQTLPITSGGTTVMAMPRVAFVRSIMLNHWYQHRGQFGVYLRLLGAKVPYSYGPSGDEAPPMMSK